jgi:hypothetical protein
MNKNFWKGFEKRAAESADQNNDTEPSDGKGYRVGGAIVGGVLGAAAGGRLGYGAGGSIADRLMQAEVPHPTLEEFERGSVDHRRQIFEPMRKKIIDRMSDTSSAAKDKFFSMVNHPDWRVRPSAEVDALDAEYKLLCRKADKLELAADRATKNYATITSHRYAKYREAARAADQVNAGIRSTNRALRDKMTLGGLTAGGIVGAGLGAYGLYKGVQHYQNKKRRESIPPQGVKPV